jgi:L1 cell adhesion molecule like protein
VNEFKRKNKVDISGNPKALRRLRTACERAKRTLSFDTEAIIDIDAIYKGIDFHLLVTRAKFEQLNMDLFEKCLETVKSCFSDAKMDKSSIDDVVLVGGSSRIPKVQQLLQDFFEGMDLYSSINPDEAVAYGAAVQAALLSEDAKNVPNLILQDVTPLSLGVEVKGDLIDVVIPKNTPIPVKKTKAYNTAYDNQRYVTIKVYEGERMKASDNNLLGLFNFFVPPAPMGHIHIKESFAIDSDGILNVSAEEETSGNKKEITITNENGRLSREEIKRMIQEAEYFKAQDMNFKERAKAINALDDYLYNVSKVMKDDYVSLKLTPIDKEMINSAMIKGKSLIDSIQQADTSVFVDYLEELQNIFESAMNKINKRPRQ